MMDLTVVVVTDRIAVDLCINTLSVAIHAPLRLHDTDTSLSLFSFSWYTAVLDTINHSVVRCPVICCRKCCSILSLEWRREWSSFLHFKVSHLCDAYLTAFKLYVSTPVAQKTSWIGILYVQPSSVIRGTRPVRLWRSRGPSILTPPTFVTGRHFLLGTAGSLQCFPRPACWIKGRRKEE